MTRLFRELEGLAILLGLVLACIVVGGTCAILGHYLTGVFYRMGATEYPAVVTAYVVTALAVGLVVGSAGGRVVMGRWWWNT